jgi:tetratricopeptide (TPR) repeat protein
MDFNNATDGDLWKHLEEADASDKGSIYLELGFRNLGRDNFNEAFSCAEAAEKAFEANDDLMGKSVAQYLNACALNATGEYDKSIEFSEKASEGFREYSEESFLGKAAWEIAIANGRMGRFDEAVEAFVSSLNLLTSAGENYLVTKVGADYGELLGS